MNLVYHYFMTIERIAFIVRVYLHFLCSSYLIFSAQGPIEHEWFLYRCIWPINMIQIGPTTPAESERKSNVIIR